jgi:hypothetical protein
LFLLCLVLPLPAAGAAGQVLDAALHHLRHGDVREWADFPERAEDGQFRVNFNAKANTTEQTLRLRHRDLRHVWAVSLNGREIHRLPQGDDSTVSLISLPPGVLKDGVNTLLVGCTHRTPEPDDVEIGDVTLLDRPRAEIVREAAFEVTITDADTARPLPCRLTIVDERGALVPLGLASNETLAVRPGVVYTSTGRVALALPAGRYTLYAGRGFEWGVAVAPVEVKPGRNPARALSIRREVDTAGLVAADTHVHTLTYSRHGDATLAERVVTLAGEGVELPVATDHNLQVDYEAAGKAAGVRGLFTPVVGNEVTTPKLGHFNVFPIDRRARLIDFRAPTWDRLAGEIDAVAPGSVVILNHARDVHGGFRPFDPLRHVSLAGENLDGRLPRANGIEVINSGATLSDPLALFHDWQGCLNRGLRLAPIGASDSHDVARFVVGQGRTYVRCDDGKPGEVDLAAAVAAIRGGRVLVSYGLLIDMKVGSAGAGDTVPADGWSGAVELTVSGPAWARAGAVVLYANDRKVHEAEIDAARSRRPGVKWKATWKLDPPPRDFFLTAVVTGPAGSPPYWPPSKPYQRTGPAFTPQWFACTGAVFVDADRSGEFDSPHAYADRIVKGTGGAPEHVLRRLETFDRAVATQAASLLRATRGLFPDDFLKVATDAPPHIRAGIADYAAAWRATEAARSAASK